MTGHFKKTLGSRAEVFHGTAHKTQYGKTKSNGGQSLEKKDLIKHNGRIVSRELHMKGKVLLKRLNDAGYFAKKGKFGSEYKKNKDKSGKSSKTRKHKKHKKHKTKRKHHTKKHHKHHKKHHKHHKKHHRTKKKGRRRNRKTGRFFGGRR